MNRYNDIPTISVHALNWRVMIDRQVLSQPCSLFGGQLRLRLAALVCDLCLSLAAMSSTHEAPNLCTSHNFFVVLRWFVPLLSPGWKSFLIRGGGRRLLGLLPSNPVVDSTRRPFLETFAAQLRGDVEVP